MRAVLLVIDALGIGAMSDVAQVRPLDAGAHTLDLGGCILTDDPATNRFVLAAGTVIASNGLGAFTAAQLGFAPNLAGGTVYLISADRSRVIDAVAFGPCAPQVAQGRFPNGAPGWQELVEPTPGARATLRRCSGRLSSTPAWASARASSPGPSPRTRSSFRRRGIAGTGRSGSATSRRTNRNTLYSTGAPASARSAASPPITSGCAPVADGSGYLNWTNIAIDLRTNLFFRACEARDYVTDLVFQGLARSNTLAQPPDSMGAVGANHFVEFLNKGIAVSDKAGQMIVEANTTNFFAIGTNFPSGDMIDPRILYDSQSNRWVACAIDVNSYQVRLAVSKTDNPTNLATGWDRYIVLEKPFGLDNDFTTLGLDSNGIYVRLLHRTFPGSQNSGHTVIAIKKPEIYQSPPNTNFVYRNITNDLPVWTVQPAVNFDDISTNDYAWFIAKGPPDLGTN